MKVLLDTCVLSLLLNSKAKAPIDPETGKPIEHIRDRVNYLIKQIKKSRATVIIPAPVLCEVLVGASSEATQEYIRILNTSPFRTAHFDSRSAIECSKLLNKLRPRTPPLEDGKNRQGIKFDHQIVSIGLVESVDAIYSDDKDILNFGESSGIKVLKSRELPLDPEKLQVPLDLMPPDND